MKISFTYRSRVLQSYTLDEVLCDSTNDEIIKGFGTIEEDIAKFFSKEVRELGITGGSINFVKLSDKGELGLILSVNSKSSLSESELEKLVEQATEKMDEGYYGPDGLYFDIDDREYYIQPVHPDFESKPVKVEQHANV